MPSTGASVADPKSTVAVATGTAGSTGTNVAKAVGMVKSAYVTPVGAGGFTAMANGMAQGAVPRGQYKGVLDIKEEEEEVQIEPKEAIPEPVKTDWGTTVHCIWLFHNKNLREHVGVSVVLPSSVGPNSRQLKNQASDDGLTMKVKCTTLQAGRRPRSTRKLAIMRDSVRNLLGTSLMLSGRNWKN
jgi:hypothetical protein